MCNAEARGVERFARQNGEKIEVVGIASNGSFEDSRAFRTRHGTRSFRNVWDAEATSWRAFRVASTPAAVLLDRRGRELRRWFGPFDEAEVLRLAGRS